MNTGSTHRKMHLVECPRDAMQGWPSFIATEKKTEYLNQLLKCGFDTLDFGSFVSPKAIPQMADTKEVLKGLKTEGSATKLLAIVANLRGAQEACTHETIKYLGFPFSVSETFQLRNTNSTMDASLKLVEEIQKLCIETKKELVIYLSMGFGNPYGDPYSPGIVLEWARKISNLGIRIISVADTVGLATAEQVYSTVSTVLEDFPDHEIGVHLHSAPDNWKEKIDAALKAGCTRFDGALKGIGGCPMANDVLVGKMNSELMIDHFIEVGADLHINKYELDKSIRIADEIFSSHN